MPQIQYRIPVILCAVASLLASVQATPEIMDSASASTQSSQKRGVRHRSTQVIKWFKKYDQIRRDAEMTWGDKWQSRLLAAAKPETRNAALASRMIKKYTTALSAMKELPPLAETRELQEGYIQYFSMARQLFADYLAAQKVVPFTNQSLFPTKKKLEELDKTNKKLDSTLRKQYAITKHKHS
jgi:hypothetical protein